MVCRDSLFVELITLLDAGSRLVEAGTGTLSVEQSKRHYYRCTRRETNKKNKNKRNVQYDDETEKKKYKPIYKPHSKNLHRNERQP